MVRKHLQQSDEALKPLRIAAERFPQQRSLAIPAIIDILLHRTPPAVEEARQVLEHWKSLPALNQSDLDRAAVSLSQILVAEQKIQEALAEAKRLGQNSPSYVPSQLLQANTLRVQSQVAKGPEKQSLIEEAYGIVENLVDSPLVKPHERREAMYLSGLLLRDLGKPKEALGMFSNLRIGHPETPESLASGVEEMEILIELGEADQVPAIASYFAKQLEHPERLKSPRFVPELLRSRMIAVGKQLIDKGFYDLAATYARILPNLCTDADRIRIESEAHRKHGEYLVREAGGNVDRFGNLRPGSRRRSSRTRNPTSSEPASSMKNLPSWNCVLRTTRTSFGPRSNVIRVPMNSNDPTISSIST